MQAVQAVKEDRFHIYRVRTVDEGMEILTGRRAGKRREDGRWEEGTINHLVQERLSQLAENARRFRDFRSGGSGVGASTDQLSATPSGAGRSGGAEQTPVA